jgi:hypothetical protein
LHSSKGHVEERRNGFVESEAVKDKGTEDVGHGCPDVEEEREGEPEVCLWVEEDLDDLAPFEFAGANTGVVCAESLDGLGALVVGEEACAFYVVVELPVYEGGGDDCDEADEKENTAAELTTVCVYECRQGRSEGSLHLP